MPRFPGATRMPRFAKRQMFSMNILDAKSYFFTQKDWDDILTPAFERYLKKVGWRIMKSARRNIRRRKKPSRPGQSPSRWSRKMIDEPGILFGYSTDPIPSVIIGPVKFKGSQRAKPLGGKVSIPQVLEQGGAVFEPDPGLTRAGEWLGPRTVIIKPRPYMSKALKQERRRALQLAQDMISNDPRAMTIARTKEAAYA